MLPFLKPKSIGAVMIHKYEDGKNEPMHEEGEPDPGLIAAMEDLMKAVHAKDVSAMAKAFQDAFEIAENEPHVDEEMGE